MFFSKHPVQTGFLLFTLGLTACSQGTHPLLAKSATKHDSAFYGTYLFVGKCQNSIASENQVKGLFTREIIATLAGGALKTGIDWLGTALQKAAKPDIDKTTISSNLTSIQQLSSTANICIQVARGQFRYQQNNSGSRDTGSRSFTNALPAKSGKHAAAPVYLVEGTEELFIEILPIIRDQVISFTPLEVRYSGYTANDRRNKHPRDLAIFVGYSPISKDITQGDFTGRLIDFGTLQPRKNKPAINKYVSADGKLSLVKQTQWLALNDTNKPVTLAVTLIETRQPGRFASFMAEVFNSSKADIKTQAAAALAELEIFKNTRALEKERLEAEREQLQNQQDYFEAEAAVLSGIEKLAALCASQPVSKTDIYNAQKDVYLARLKANISAVLAGKSRPYNPSEIKPPSGICQ